MSEDILNMPFRPFFNASLTAAALTNYEGKIFAANPAFVKLIKQPASRVIGLSFLNFIPSDKNRAARESFDTFVRRKLLSHEFDTSIIRPDDQPVHALLALTQVHDSSEKPMCLLLTMTERTAEKGAVQEREPDVSLSMPEIWSQVLDRLPQALLLINFAHYIEEINKHGEEVLGYSRYDLRHRPMDTLFPEFSKHLSEIGTDPLMSTAPIATYALHKNGYQVPLTLALKTIQLGDRFYWLGCAHNSVGNLSEAPRSASMPVTESELFVRINFQEQLDRALKRAERRREKLAVLLLNVDRYKQQCDSYGTNTVHQLIDDIRKRVFEYVRASDFVTKFDIDQFAIMLEGIKRAEDAAVVAQKLCNAFLPPFLVNDDEVYLTGSVGISVSPEDGTNADRLIKNAESAMYQVIKDGGNSFLFFTSEIQSRAMERTHMENELRRALRNREFVVYYQPMLNGDGNKVTCLEALLRWNHPRRGIVPPMTFMSILEETGLIANVGEWVLRSACQDINKLHHVGYEQLRVSVNISARQLAHRSFFNTLRQTLQETRVDPRTVNLEITESVLLKNTEENREIMRDLAAYGVNLVLDDFGTGCSSLSYLKHFPIHALKLDRNFVQGLPTERWDAAITDAVLVLATSLGLKVTAEGVENDAQHSYLHQRNCHEMQGFLFARPMPLKEIDAWLRRQAN